MSAEEIPEHVQQARLNGDATPQGVHTCQRGRADGATWVFTDDYWSCPFCGDHGKEFVGDIENWNPTGFLNAEPPSDQQEGRKP